MPKNQHEDFGEKIGGAKKDLWRDRGLYVDDLGSMNDREAEKYVKKDNVWKKPNYQAMLDDGVPIGVVYVATGGDGSSDTTVTIPSIDVSDVGTGLDSASTSAEESETDTPTTPAPPAGQATVVENVTGSGGREFFTIQTQDENTFYLVVDRESESENVYFLDTVKESDLLSLAEKDDGSSATGESAIPDPEPVCICTDKCVPGEVNTDCPVCILSLKDCIGTAPAVDPDVEPEPEKDSGSGTIILIVVAALAAGGAGYYIKIYKPKKDLDDAEDFDDLTAEDEDEETVNEDDEDDAPNFVPYEEPDEPDYPEGYGYEEPEEDE